MSGQRGVFRAPWWATLGALALGGVFVSAGLWQLDRADERRALLAAFDAGRNAAPLPAPGRDVDPAALRYRSITASGHFDAQHQVLLDARTRDGRAGYEVLTPLLGGDVAILVNRGWVPAAPDRQRLPDIKVGTETRRITGLLDRLPVAALKSAPERATAWPRRLLFPTSAEIGAALGYPVTDYQLLLAPEAADGFRRDWRPDIMTPQQHLGYAVQWFALAAALGVIYAVLGFRKPAAGPDTP